MAARAERILTGVNPAMRKGSTRRGLRRSSVLAQSGSFLFPLRHCANCAYKGLLGAVPLIGRVGFGFFTAPHCASRFWGTSWRSGDQTVSSRRPGVESWRPRAARTPAPLGGTGHLNSRETHLNSEREFPPCRPVEPSVSSRCVSASFGCYCPHATTHAYELHAYELAAFRLTCRDSGTRRQDPRAPRRPHPRRPGHHSLRRRPGAARRNPDHSPAAASEWSRPPSSRTGRRSGLIVGARHMAPRALSKPLLPAAPIMRQFIESDHRRADGRRPRVAVDHLVQSH